MNNIQEIKELIQESFKLDKNNNYEMNFDLWKNGTNKILYITGLMGSGKSTFAKKLSKEYNCYLLELDQLQKTTFKKYGMIDENIYMEKFIKEMNKLIKPHKRVIVEGIQIMFFPMLQDSLKPTDSVLIINTNLITSTFQSIKRDGLDQIFNNIMSNLDFYKHLTKFKKQY